MNKIIGALFILMIFPIAVFAIDANNHTLGVQTNLEQTLSSLKESITKLSLENEEISRINTSVRQHIRTADEALKKLEQEGLKQEQQYQLAQEKDKQKRAPLKELEARSFQLDEMMTSLDQEILQQVRLMKESENEESRVFAVTSVLLEQVQALRLELTQAVKVIQTPEKIDRHQLARDLMASEERLKRTKEEWVLLQELLERDQNKLGDFKTENSAIQTKIEEASVDLEELKGSLVTLEAFIRKFSTSDQENLKTIVELEKDIQKLTQQIVLVQSSQDNRTQVTGALNSKMAKSKEVEVNKLQSLYQELEKENASLRLDLKQLRQKMVDLDKQRVLLEKGLTR